MGRHKNCTHFTRSTSSDAGPAWSRGRICCTEAACTCLNRGWEVGHDVRAEVSKEACVGEAIGTFQVRLPLPFLGHSGAGMEELGVRMVDEGGAQPGRSRNRRNLALPARQPGSRGVEHPAAAGRHWAFFCSSGQQRVRGLGAGPGDHQLRPWQGRPRCNWQLRSRGAVGISNV